jgi:putative DNA primase/helicase
LPAALAELLTAQPEPRPIPAPNGYKPGDGYGVAALAGEVERVRSATSGTRNDTLNRAAFALGQLTAAGVLDRATVEGELLGAALAVGLGEGEAVKTIQSGLNKGEQAPRAIPDPKDGEPRDVAEARRKKRPTDDELRDRVHHTWPEVVYGLGEFMAFDGAVYRPLEREIVRQRVTGVLEAAKSEGIRPTAARLASVLEMLRDKVFVSSNVWDADTTLLPCINGALHIPSRELRPHSAANFFTTRLPYEFDADAAASTWLWFVNRTLPDAREFVQEFAGYALTTDTRHELAVWLYGPPGSGKSTFLLGLQTMLGPRAGLLSLADVERNRFALANLPGKTLVVSTEQPSDYIASGALLNGLISGEPVTVDRKFRDAVEIVSRAKLCWAMNTLPRVGDTNSGLFRRVKVIKFPALAPEQRDATLKDIIATEGAGILNWALEGLDRLMTRGTFDVPACVIDATEEFRATNDIPAEFVAERCLTGGEFKAQASQLYKAYREWALETGHKPQSSTSLATDWQRLGFERRRAAGRAYWYGVGLKDE